MFKRLCRVQMWKQLFHKLRYGVADRPLNFNKVSAPLTVRVLGIVSGPLSSCMPKMK